MPSDSDGLRLDSDGLRLDSDGLRSDSDGLRSVSNGLCQNKQVRQMNNRVWLVQVVRRIPIGLGNNPPSNYHNFWSLDKLFKEIKKTCRTPDRSPEVWSDSQKSIRRPMKSAGPILSRNTCRRGNLLKVCFYISNYKENSAVSR